jgi:hypothetical protein
MILSLEQCLQRKKEMGAGGRSTIIWQYIAEAVNNLTGKQSMA